MLSSLQKKIPVKTVTDDTVFTITDVSMYREPKHQFFPSNRHKRAEDGAGQSQQGSHLENYPSPSTLDLDIAMFILPLRTPLEDLCPVTPKEKPTKNNFISEDHWKWRAVTSRDKILTSCAQVETFDREKLCYAAPDLRAQFPDRYRAACAMDLAP